jgi:hypothetical protein
MPSNSDFGYIEEGEFTSDLPRFPTEMNLRGIKNLFSFFLCGNRPLMSFRHLRMINSASKYLKDTL